ncbi:hypothetical protein P2I39_10000 [Mannheimia haemolytica]|nr:hypothetical protein [Mannheimia haemolytica]MDW0580637.1 hypothetical protein [Mannheimia haemolytica]MDW0588678.1 hypothetical protein [Mannheimia haemolytica]MDW0607173.1 hypothetical protein [Mannheimia haemolytica]MDW0635961.1 hypothetical protein [Mannheimia haemolytica]
MKNLPLSMADTLAVIYPAFDFAADDKSATEQQISLLNFRITMANQLLIACIETIEKNPNFWAEIDLNDFKKYLNQNKVVIFDTQQYFTDGSRTMAILDNMKSNIRKIEQQLSQATAFNFDLERMKERLNDTFHEVPKDITNVNEFRNWLKGVANGH